MQYTDAQFSYVKPPKPKWWASVLFWLSLFAQMMLGLLLMDVSDGLSSWFMEALTLSGGIALVISIGVRAARREAYYEGRLLPKIPKSKRA